MATDASPEGGFHFIKDFSTFHTHRLKKMAWPNTVCPVEDSEKGPFGKSLGAVGCCGF